MLKPQKWQKEGFIKKCSLPTPHPQIYYSKKKNYSWIFFHKLTTYLTLAKIINLNFFIKKLRNLRTEFGQPFCELEKGRKEADNWMNEDGDGGVGSSRLD